MWDNSSTYDYTDFLAFWNYNTDFNLGKSPSVNGNTTVNGEGTTVTGHTNITKSANVIDTNINKDTTVTINTNITGNTNLTGNTNITSDKTVKGDTTATTENINTTTNDNTLNQEKIDIYTIFSRSNIILLIWFLAIYVVLSFILNILYKTPNSQTSNVEIGLMTSRTFDVILFIFILFLIVVFYNDISINNAEDKFMNGLNRFGNYVDHRSSIFSSLLFIFVFYVFIYLFNIPMYSDNKSIFITIIEFIAWAVFLICLFNLFFWKLFGFSLIDSIIQFINDLFGISKDAKTGGDNNHFFYSTNTSSPTVAAASAADTSKPSDNKTSVNTTPIVTTNNKVPSDNEEVFNVSNNIYTYKDAAAVCNSYGARLANYDDIEQSYNEGGEWCNYGWSDGQMIYYPTQKDTWEKLQKKEATKNSCGRPGINGGYMKNPYLKFGVNCYGIKPPAKDSDLRRMDLQKHEIVAKSSQDIELDKKVKYWKDNSDQMMNVNSFNNKKWSEY